MNHFRIVGTVLKANGTQAERVICVPTMESYDQLYDRAPSILCKDSTEHVMSFIVKPIASAAVANVGYPTEVSTEVPTETPSVVLTHPQTRYQAAMANAAAATVEFLRSRNRALGGYSTPEPASSRMGGWVPKGERHKGEEVVIVAPPEGVVDMNFKAGELINFSPEYEGEEACFE